MESFELVEVCGKCGHHGVKVWKCLSDDEKIIARRLPAAAEYSSKELEKLAYCIRCSNIQSPQNALA